MQVELWWQWLACNKGQGSPRLLAIKQPSGVCSLLFMLLPYQGSAQLWSHCALDGVTSGSLVWGHGPGWWSGTRPVGGGCSWCCSGQLRVLAITSNTYCAWSFAACALRHRHRCSSVVARGMLGIQCSEVCCCARAHSDSTARNQVWSNAQCLMLEVPVLHDAGI
jgi:hypothetical protein